MDLGSAIFGLLAVACFVVPVIYLQMVKKNERKKFLKEFLQLAEQEQLKISAHDFWNHSCAIGIDTNKNKLLFLKKQEGNEQKVIIDLVEVEKCSLINISRNVNDNRVVDRLGLGFTFRNGKHPENSLDFYNKEENLSINDEHTLSEKWKATINEHLQARPESAKQIQLKNNTRSAA